MTGMAKSSLFPAEHIGYSRMKILYLYVEVPGYTMSTIRTLAASGCEKLVVYWDTKNWTLQG